MCFWDDVGAPGLEPNFWGVDLEFAKHNNQNMDIQKQVAYPIGSMYAVFTCMYRKNLGDPRGMDGIGLILVPK